ncbi:hypothetical protein BDM02DRAFT_3266414 [Thelephora ganbajun]|uniref:Uncharacterized protein n=1 Tax=Thelephora ganbajun TaxID=370292 RepID=A0ACB6ZS26_THEGA|nr:hypothetical protein BDM02DRAFT_3266414 [Thelephora ganbajun]
MEQPLRLHETITAFSQPDAIKAAQVDIDNEIQRLNSSVCSLKSRRNSLCSVSRLPPEVLSDVFLVLAEQLQAQDRFRVDFKWISVTHVCHLWRHVALQHGRLWGKIDMISQDRTRAFVDRSKGAPLAVRQSFIGSLAELPTTFTDPSYRYRELHLRAKEGQLGPNVLQVLNSPIHAPVLESLVLEVSDNYPEYTLPPTVFDYKAPVLTRLQLQNVRMEWPTSVFPSLTHLSIHHSGNTNSPRPSVSQVLTALKNMPRLEYLHLVDQTIFEQPLPLNNAPVEEFPSIPLPHLATLQLFGTAYDCTTIVSHIIPSSFVDLEIHCTEVESVSEVQALMNLVKDNFARSRTIDSSSLLSIRMNAGVGELSLNVDVISDMKPKRIVSLGMYPKVGEFFKRHASAVFPIVFGSIPAAAAKRLDVRSKFSVSPDAWAHVLNRMSEVRVLDAYFAGAVNLSHALESRIANTPSFVGKQLKSLTFSGVSFTHKTSQQVRFHDALLECLQKRSDGDQRIKNLDFHSCSDVGGGVALQFGKVAHKVRWDQESEEDLLILSE